MSRSRTLAAVIAIGAATLTATEAQAAPALPAAVVSLGDSYISGEAGRWRGNALENSGDKWGTDLATKCDANGCTTNPQWIYGDTHTDTDMCHRSTSAEIISAAIPNEESMHPNYYGQRALGTCLRLMHEKVIGDFTCHNTRGTGPARMTLSPITTSREL
jgi:hypothetical protein